MIHSAALAWLCLGLAIGRGLTLAERWRQADVRRRDAELADQLAAAGAHDVAARLRAQARH